MIELFTDANLNRIEHLQSEGWDDIRPLIQFYGDAPFYAPV